MAHRLAKAAVAALIVSMGAAVAHADPVKAGASFTARDNFAPDLNDWGPQNSHRSLNFDAKKGKWGLKLDMNQSAISGMAWAETGAGAYYRITPGLHVGGGVTVDSSASDDRRGLSPQERPRVKLETAFKF